MDSPQDRSLDRKSTGIAREEPSGQVSRQEKYIVLEDSSQDMSLDRKSTGIAGGQPSG